MYKVFEKTRTVNMTARERIFFFLKYITDTGSPPCRAKEIFNVSERSNIYKDRVNL